MPGEYRRKANLTMNTLEQTSAQWAVDTRIHDVNVVLVPTDGADQGKHKMADGLKTYAELSFVEDSSTPSSGTIQITPFLYLSAGEGQGIYQYQFQNDGKPCYVLVGATASPENLANCVVWADAGSGLKWYVTAADAEVLYTSDSDVATPDLATGWTADAGVDAPTPSIFLVAGPTVQDALEQVAARVPNEKVWEGYITQVDTDPPTVVELTNTLGGTPVLSYDAPGVYYATLAGAFTVGKTSSWVGVIASGSSAGGMFTDGFMLAITPDSADALAIVTGVIGSSTQDAGLTSAYFKITVKR